MVGGRRVRAARNVVMMGLPRPGRPGRWPWLLEVFVLEPRSDQPVDDAAPVPDESSPDPAPIDVPPVPGPPPGVPDEDWPDGAPPVNPGVMDPG